MEDSKVALLIERIQQPRILHDRIHPKEKPKAAPPKTSKKLLMLINRLEMRAWLRSVEGQLMETITYLRGEVKFIEHLPHCWVCQMELKLNVERYNGNRSAWYLCLENNEYLEEQYPDCPKERNYHIGSYWEQLKHYEKYGNTDVPGENTVKFILDRAKWAYKIMGKQIHLARQLLRLVRKWDFSDRIILEFNKVYEELGMYEIANLTFPFSVWGEE